MGYLWELRPYFRQVAGQLVLGSLTGIVMNTAVVLPAILLGRVIDAALALERGTGDAAAVTWAALLFVGGTLATEGPRVLKRWWLMTANARIRTSLRADCLRGVLAWPAARLHQTPVGDLMARIIGDVEVLGVGVREFTIETWDTVLFSISFVVALFVYDPGLSALSLLPVPVALWLSHAVGRWVQAHATGAREASAALTAALHEQLAGVRVLRLFGRAGAAAGRIAALSARYAGANLAVVRLRGGLQPVYTAVLTCGVVLVVWQGGLRVLEGAFTVGAFVAYVELYLRFVNRGFRIPQLVNSVQTGAAAYARLRPLLAPPLPVDCEPPLASFRPWRVTGLDAHRARRNGAVRRHGRPETARSSDSGPAAPSASGPVAVTADNVTFRYPGASGPALQGVTLTIPAGALVGVTGPVGAGKSALARALLGLYPLEAGQVRLDGQPVEAIPAARRAARAGYLPQDGYLFSGTVRENVLLGTEDAPGAAGALDGAISLAALDQDVRAFPRGLDTEIGELGIRVSGGQRQRIALARALAGSRSGSGDGDPHAGGTGGAPCPPDGAAGGAGGTPAALAAWCTPGLLLLDDPFSAVDLDIEVRIVAALREAFGPTAPPERRATIVLSSHRLAAFSQSDLVVVLDTGRVRELGTHAELMRADGLYARIYRAQRRVEAVPAVPEPG